MTLFFQQIINGLAIGCIYALVAIGFVLIYKATEVINFAQGELMMVGAFIAFTCINYLQIPFLAAILITLFFMALLGALLERTLLRPLVGEAAFTMVMLTIGLGIFIRGIAGMIWGYDTFKFSAGITDQPVQISGLAISSVNLWIIGITLLMIIGLYLFFNRTKMGVSIEATSQNQLAAYLMGISVKGVFSKIWALSAIVGAVAGILLTPIQFLNYNMSFIGLKAFPAAVLGGFGSIPGAIVGGIIIGVSEALAGVYLPAGFKDVFAWIILIAVLMIRPEGIFGAQRSKRV